MPARKTTAASREEANNLRKRLSTLSDRILILENDLKSTQMRIQKDMTRLIKMVQEGK